MASHVNSGNLWHLVSQFVVFFVFPLAYALSPVPPLVEGGSESSVPRGERSAERGPKDRSPAGTMVSRQPVSGERAEAKRENKPSRGAQSPALKNSLVSIGYVYQRLNCLDIEEIFCLIDVWYSGLTRGRV